jgi:proteasome lid subunit RPN8/RPN11
MLNYATVMYKLAQEIVTAMQSHAEECYPEECCGLLGGVEALFVDYYPLINCAEVPTKSFFADPAELFQIMHKMRKRGQPLLGIYHSHPTSPAYPSARDIEWAFYPEAINFIFSLNPVRELRAFQIVEGTVRTINFAIVNIK